MKAWIIVLGLLMTIASAASADHFGHGRHGGRWGRSGGGARIYYYPFFGPDTYGSFWNGVESYGPSTPNLDFGDPAADNGPALPWSIAMPQRPAPLAGADILLGEKRLYCERGTVLRLAGSFTAAKPLVACVLNVDGHVLATDAVALDRMDYEFYWTADSTGTHPIKVTYNYADGTQTVLRNVVVCVDPRAPLTVSQLPSSISGDLAVNLDRASTSDFDLDHAILLLDGTPADIPSGTSKISLPTHTLPSADYDVYLVLYDVDGERFITRRQTFLLDNGKSSVPGQLDGGPQESRFHVREDSSNA